MMSSIRLGANLFRLLPFAARTRIYVLAGSNGRCFSAQMKESQEKSPASSDLILTDCCVEHLKKHAANGEFLRVSVEGGGCSGFSYKFDLDADKEEDDLTFTRDGVEVVTDTESFALIKGSKIDHETELIKSAFKLTDNPQSSTKGNCSCGVSFSVDP